MAKKFILKDIILDEISLVDRPANPGAKVVFWKRDEAAVDPTRQNIANMTLNIDASQITKAVQDAIAAVKNSEAVEKVKEMVGGAIEKTKVFLTKAGDWDESKHPREDDGKFGEGGGGSSGADGSGGEAKNIGEGLGSVIDRRALIEGYEGNQVTAGGKKGRVVGTDKYGQVRVRFGDKTEASFHPTKVYLSSGAALLSTYSTESYASGARDRLTSKTGVKHKVVYGEEKNGNAFWVVPEKNVKKAALDSTKRDESITKLATDLATLHKNCCEVAQMSPSSVQPTVASTFDELLERREVQERAQEFSRMVYALQDSINSITNDPELRDDVRRDLLERSLNEFKAAVEEEMGSQDQPGEDYMAKATIQAAIAKSKIVLNS